MRKSLYGKSSVFLTLVALSVFLFAITSAFARDMSVPSGTLNNPQGFGLHGGIYPLQQSSGVLPSNVSPSIRVVGSSNWAGFYVGTGSGPGFKQVIGSWNTPCTSGPIDNNHLAAQWVGIGGVYGGQHLLQVGTTLLPDGRFHTFYELFPKPPVISSRSFKCADAFTAEVDYNLTSKGTNKNHIFIKDISAGFTLDYVVPDSQFKPDLQSAEWIDERPSCSSSLTDLANFHYVFWSNPQARSNTNTGMLEGIGSFANSAIVMQDKQQHTLAKPDGLNSNNTFKDRWYNAGIDGHC